MKPLSLVIGLLAVAALLIWIAVAQMPDGRLHVIVLDVESGQAVIVRTPSGRSMLIDGGPNAPLLLSALGSYLPFWQHSLHAVVATHQGTSALVPLIDVSQRYTLGSAFGPPAGEKPSAAYQRWQEILTQRGVHMTAAEPGLRLILDDGIGLTVVGQAEGRLSLLLEYAGTSILLAASSGALTTPATVVVAPASALTAPSLPGSATAQAIILVNGPKRPDSALPPSADGIRMFATAVDGTVEIISNGETLRIAPRP